MPDRPHPRYGVFLTPDPKTSAAVTTITSLVRAQFGLVSAGRFPPHITLAGSLPLAAQESELLAAVETIVASHRTFDIHNGGLDRLGHGIVFNVHNTVDGRPNRALVGLAVGMTQQLRPLLRETGGLAADLAAPDSWRGHLSLASHELRDRADLRREVKHFIQELEIPCPASFPAATVTVYRLHHSDWHGSWWTDFEWEHVRSFTLEPGRAGG